MAILRLRRERERTEKAEISDRRQVRFLDTATLNRGENSMREPVSANRKI